MKRGIGFRYAFRGIYAAFKAERNLKIHFIAAIAVIAAGVFFKLAVWEWSLILLCCGLTIAFELINAAIERLCNRISPEWEPVIRDVKDMAAGAVLVAALISVAVAVLVFIF